MSDGEVKRAARLLAAMAMASPEAYIQRHVDGSGRIVIDGTFTIESLARVVDEVARGLAPEASTFHYDGCPCSLCHPA